MKRLLLLWLWVAWATLADGPTAWAQTTPYRVTYGIRLDADLATYRVFMRLTSTSATAPTSLSMARISSAQVTIRVPHGTGTNRFLITNVVGKTGVDTQGQPADMFWTFNNARANAPQVCANGSVWGTPGCTAVASAYDYISFGYNYGNSSVQFDIPLNQDIEIFRFTRSGPCLGAVELFDNQTDPFRPNNSLNTNPPNQMAIFEAAGITDLYGGNFLASAQCLVVTGAPDLSLSISGPSTLTAGIAGTYAINLMNVGTSITSGVLSATTLLPSGLSYGGMVVMNGWNCTPTSLTNGNTQVVCTSSAGIAASASSSYSFLLTAAANVATATFSAGVLGGGDLNVSNNVSNKAITVVQALRPDISIAATGPASLAAGSGGAYSFIVSNAAGGAATTGATSFTFALPVGLSYNGFSGSGWGVTSAVVNGQTVYTASYAAAIAAGAAANTLTINLLAAASAGSGLVAVAGGVSTAGETALANNGLSLTINLIANVSAPQLAASIAGLGTLAAGGGGSYTISLSNTGTGPMGAATSGITSVTFSLPAGLSYNGFSGSGWGVTSAVINGQTVYTAQTLVSIAANGGTANPLLINVLAGSGAGGTQVQFGGAASTPGQTSPAWAAFSQAISISGVVGSPSLGGTLTGPGTTIINTASTFVYSLTNTGNVPTTGPTTNILTLPAGFVFNNFTGSGWQVSSAVQPNGSTSVTLTYPASVGAGQPYPTLQVNITPATVSAPSNQTFAVTGTTPGSTNTVSIQLPVSVQPVVAAQPDLSVTFSGPASVVSGLGASYSIAVGNSGAATTGPVTVTFTLPNGLIYNGLIGSSGWGVSTQVINGQTVYTATNSAIVPAGGSASPLVLNLLSAGGAAGTLGSITGGAITIGEVNLTNNTFTLVVSRTTSGGGGGSLSYSLVTTIQVLNPAPNPFETVPVRIVVTNSGPGSATGVLSQITLPFGNPLLSFTASQGQYTNGQWNIGTLTAGQSVTLTMHFSGMGGIGTIINQIIAPLPNPVPATYFAQACFSVPIDLCAGQTYTVSLSGSPTGIQWRRNGQPISGATSASLTITQPGTYSVDTSAGCGSGGCCPLIVREGLNCCTTNVCVPMAVRKTR
jgi:hypothetical protein